jgi:hypothetical protein
MLGRTMLLSFGFEVFSFSKNYVLDLSYVVVTFYAWISPFVHSKTL